MSDNPNTIYQPETAGSIMSINVPTCRPGDTQEDIMKQIAIRNWDTIRDIYVVNAEDKLEGFITLPTLLRSDAKIRAHTMMQSIKHLLNPSVDQEKAVFLAVKEDLVSIPVIDDDNRFLGVVTAHTIIDVMHDEHIEDMLLTAGIHSKNSNIVKLSTSRIGLIVKTRAPWLMVGLIAGLGLGLISSWFEASLTKTIALAYFIPVVAYIADSVGTQSEAITVRTLAVMKVNTAYYLLKEILVGLTLGLIIGLIGTFGAGIIAGDFRIGIVVGLSLFLASAVASVLASLIPIAFKTFGKDPALGSGPLATALQDMISIIIYFVFAVLLLK